MAYTATVFGLLLTVLGLAGYLLAGAAAVTALIAAFFGSGLHALGFRARAQTTRKHAMHAAAAVALIGFIGAVMSVLRAPFATRSALANFSQVAMAVLSAAFIFLCVKSFRAARRARVASPPR